MSKRKVKLPPLGDIELTSQEINFITQYVKDFSVRRAARVSGYQSDAGLALLDDERIVGGIQMILARNLEQVEMDKEWLLREALDNHLIARQLGNLTASNAALKMIGQHVNIEAFAATKIELSSDKEVMRRLVRGRDRSKGDNAGDRVTFH